MTWDPELDDPLVRRGASEPGGEGRGPGHGADEDPPPAWRTAPPDVLTPIDPDAPISGHVPPPEGKPIAEAPEHDWTAARSGLFPLLRPVGTLGTRLDAVEPAAMAQHADQKHTQPLIDDGPEGLVIVYAIASSGFDVITNGDHMLAWGVGPAEVRDAAYANLARWSAGLGWTEEADGERRLVSSASGGWDASRILLSEVREHLSTALGASGGRVLVGLPDRDLLVAARVADGDPEFARQFSDFVSDQADAADEPVDARVFELRDRQLVVAGA